MVQPPAILPDTPKTRQDMADYMTTVAHADACLGTVMDPLERHNLASDTAFRDARIDMDRRLKTWMVKTDDPVMTGGVRAPAGAKIDPREAMDPS